MAKDITITAQLETIMSEYDEDVQATIETCCKLAANKCRNDIRAASPIGTGKDAGRYKRGWAVKKTDKGLLIGRVVYNKTDYQLTHLLEKSHVIKNQYGTYGRTNPQPHIAPAAEAAEKYFQELLKQNL